MIRSWSVTLLLLILLSTTLLAQNKRSGNRIEIEADPIAYIFRGYSFHLGYTMGHLRFDAGVFGIKQPDFALENDLFSVYSSGVGIKIDYLIKRNKGLFIGLQSDYGTDKTGLKSSSTKVNSDGVTLGLRTGYRFMFGKKENQCKGLYLVPWIALIHSPDPVTINESAHEYIQRQWSVFPTIHLGYRF